LEEIKVGVRILTYDEGTKKLVMEKGEPLDELPFEKIPDDADL